MTDPLVERFFLAFQYEALALVRQKVMSGDECSALVSSFARIAAAEVRAFLAERVTVEKVADALLNVRTSGRPLSVSVRGQLEAAVLALLRREVGTTT